MKKSPLQLFDDTLLLIPCSGEKQNGSKPSKVLSILSALSPSLASALAKARAELRHEAHVDETLMPAHIRYSGELYKHGSMSIGRAVAAGRPVLIVSGGYGLLLAAEPIGWYAKKFKLCDWPGGLLDECILDYCRHKRIRSVIAVMARTTNYAALIRHVEWRRAGLAASLVSPVGHARVPVKEVPRAQGQAVAALFDRGLDQTWRSSDSLSLEIERL